MLRFISTRLQYKLILAFVLVLLIPAAITSTYNIQRSNETLTESARLNQLQVATSRTRSAEALLTGATADTLFLSQAPEVRRYVNAPQSTTLGNIERLFQAFLGRSTGIYTNACLLDASGQEVVCVDVVEGVPTILPTEALENQSNQAYFSRTLSLTSLPGRQAPVYVSSLDLERTQGVFVRPYIPTIRYATLLQSDEGAISGILVLKALVAPIFEALSEDTQTEAVYLVDSDGNYLLHPDERLLYGNLVGTGITLMSERPKDSSEILTQAQGTLFGSDERTDTLQVFARIKPTGQATIQWTVIYEYPLATILGDVRGTQQVIIAITLISLVAAVLAALFITQGIVRPIRQLAAAAGSISQGNYRPITDIHNRDEIGLLVQSFNEMSERIETRTTELIEARTIAEESVRLKSEFLSTMSHELRTPLNAILGFSGILLEDMGGEIDEDARHMLTRVYSNSERLLTLINEILDLAKIESGRMDLASAPFSPRELAHRWQSQMNVLATQKGLTFHVHTDSKLPEKINGDVERLTQIATNLLSNAFKFTEKGEVRLDVERQDKNWVIRVSDTGIGIPPHALNYIFDEFRQVDGSSKRVYGGTGLGLAIVRKICMMMDGQVIVKSTLAEGSIFTVILPLGITTHVSKPDVILESL